jgi:spore coat protein U domain-containing protein, fimbrial subunit CupE1/2/3/6
MRIDRIAPLAAGVLVALSGAAQAAGTATTSFGVSASVAANCIVTAVPMPFGAYDGTAAKTTSQDLKVRCTKDLPYTVKLSGGDANSFAPRKLKDGGTNTLEYNLFSDGGRTSVWGDGVGASAVPGVGNGMGVASAVTHTIFAELFNSLANQAAPVGNYADTIAVEVAY